MGKIKKVIRKSIVALVGFPLLVVGIILIPLPGPGLLVCFLALFILSLEFDWASSYFDKAKVQIKKIVADTKERIDQAKRKD